MNSYSFNFYNDTTSVIGFASADAPSALRLCRSIGYLWMASKKIVSAGRPEIGAGKFTAAKAVITLDFLTPKRLPKSIEPQKTMQLMNGAGSASQMLVAIDDQMTDIVSNLDRPIVQKGSLIVAIVEGGIDISNELDMQLQIPCGMDANGQQYLVIGQATANAQDGVYATPFSVALAHAILDTRSSSNVPVLINTNNTVVNKTSGISKR